MFKTSQKKYVKHFSEAQHLVRIALYKSLYTEFNEEMDLENAKILAAQTVNYLTGADFLHQENISPKLIDEATRRGLSKLDQDPEVLHLIVELNKGVVASNEWQYGKKYSVSSEYENVKQILSYYVDDFPDRFVLVDFKKLAESYSRKIM